MIVGVGLLVVWFYVKLGLMFPGKTFVGMNETLFGKWFGKMISVGFVYMMLHSAASLLFYSGNFMALHLLPETPMEAIEVVMAMVMVIGARLGIETFSGTAEIFIFFFSILFILLTVFLLPEIKIENLQPIFETDMKAMLRATFISAESIIFPVVALFMIFPAFVNQTKTVGKHFLTGYLIGGLAIIVIILLSVPVLGADVTARQQYPSYVLARKINVGNFFQRVEAFLALTWFILVYFKMLLYFYAGALGLSQILNLKGYRPLTFPLGMIVVVLSTIIYPTVTYQQNWDRDISTMIWFLLGIILPLIMLTVGIVKKKNKRP
ncbi:GerAB/ArcD/ProY family transporter [Shouchella shacheensis]|uniref:GerAB/ArcD/ProY family transporter n=1 Tax=Shouchella shacheensis TaxID=1649580 RepID=UPI00073FAF4C|nr:endospore germination permease [Shouchella shacheensis]